jgi:uncharacterized protein
MLLESIKKRSLEATKGRRVVERNVLRFVIGEVQLMEIRQKKTLPDEQIATIIRKTIENNKEALSHRPDEKLEQENRILTELLPSTLSQEEIESVLVVQLESIRACGNDGQAMGVAMKHLKSSGVSVLGDDVKAVVSKLRE